ncbi:MAG: nitroreductase family protein [Ahrensia sp.]|nr:nitroreductase family protein [Ahrensia sp.]
MPHDQKAPHIALNFVQRDLSEIAARSKAFAAAMETRRTVRDYKPTPVPRQIIENCIRAAGSAPSGANQQPWHFVAISDHTAKRAIREAAEAEERAFYAGRAGAEWIDALAHLGTNDQKPFLEWQPRTHP